MLSLRNIVDPRRHHTPRVKELVFMQNNQMAEKEGFDSRLRARSGPALTLHWSVIHSRPFKSLQISTGRNKKPEDESSGVAEKEGFEPSRRF